MEEKIDVIVNEVQNTNTIIKELKSDVDILMKLNNEQKKINNDVSILLKDMSVTLASVRKDIDKIVKRDMGEEYRKIAYM